MKKIAIIGASYLQVPIIIKAKKLGYETHVFAWQVGDEGEKIADYFYPISIIEKEKILQKCMEVNIDGICTIASDLANITVNYVAEKLKLVGNGMISTAKSTNKYLMRKAFEKAGDPIPRYVLLRNFEDIDKIELEYPIIVKPTDRSGSRGIYKVENIDELKSVFQKSLEVSFEKQVLIEEFVEGHEYSVEYISYKGEHKFLALTTKKTTGPPYFIETGHVQPSTVELEILEKIKAVISHALDTLEVKNGASHSEIKIDDDGNIKIIEIGARMGGDYIGSDMVFLSTGYDFVKMVIEVALGKSPDFSIGCEPRKIEVVYILSQDDLECYNNIKKKTPQKIIKVSEFDLSNLGKTTDSSTRVGCYIVERE